QITLAAVSLQRLKHCVVFLLISLDSVHEGKVRPHRICSGHSLATGYHTIPGVISEIRCTRISLLVGSESLRPWMVHLDDFSVWLGVEEFVFLDQRPVEVGLLASESVLANLDVLVPRSWR
ncbi:hypothetical protein EGW08_013509, partial [Elysia chlorotica]